MGSLAGVGELGKHTPAETNGCTQEGEETRIEIVWRLDRIKQRSEDGQAPRVDVIDLV